LAFTRAQDEIELAQAHLRLAPIRFLRWEALDARDEIQQVLVAEIPFLEMLWGYGAVHQGDRGGIRHAVVSRLPIAGPPLFRIARHGPECRSRSMHVHLCDLPDIRDERACFQRGVRDRLRVLTERKSLRGAFHDLEWFAASAELGQLERPVAHCTKEAVAALEDGRRSGHAALREPAGEYGIAIRVRV